MKYDGCWYNGIQNLQPGDLCQVRFMARSYWMNAKLINNGGSGFWEAELTEEVFDKESNTIHPAGYKVQCYAEQVRAR